MNKCKNVSRILIRTIQCRASYFILNFIFTFYRKLRECKKLSSLQSRGRSTDDKILQLALQIFEMEVRGKILQ